MEGHGRVAHILPSSDQLQLGATLYLYVAVPSQGYSEDEKIWRILRNFLVITCPPLKLRGTMIQSLISEFCDYGQLKELIIKQYVFLGYFR